MFSLSHVLTMELTFFSSNFTTLFKDTDGPFHRKAPSKHRIVKNETKIAENDKKLEFCLDCSSECNLIKYETRLKVKIEKFEVPYTSNVRFFWFTSLQ